MERFIDLMQNDITMTSEPLDVPRITERPVMPMSIEEAEILNVRAARSVAESIEYWRAVDALQRQQTPIAPTHDTQPMQIRPKRKYLGEESFIGNNARTATYLRRQGRN